MHQCLNETKRFDIELLYDPGHGTTFQFQLLKLIKIIRNVSIKKYYYEKG